jgi:hypothetical protein
MSHFIAFVLYIEFIHQIFSKKADFLLSSLTSTMNWLHNSIHILLGVKLHFLLLRKRCRFLICFITFICYFAFHLLFNHWEWFIRVIVWRFWSVLGFNIISLFIDFKAKKFNPANSSKVVLSQQLLKENLSLLTDTVYLKRQMNVVCVDGADEHCDRFRLEGTHPKKHFIQNHSQRPYISLCGIVLSFQYFGSHINWWS